GRPKGVLVEHRSICNRLLWMAEAYGMTEADTTLVLAPFTFDVSLWEMVVPLLVGGRAVVPDAATVQDPAEVVHALRRHRVTIVEFVPAMLAHCLEVGEIVECSELSRVLCGSDTLTPAIQARFFERLPGAALYNVFGPTETAIDSLWWRCLSESATVPI